MAQIIPLGQGSTTSSAQVAIEGSTGVCRVGYAFAWVSLYGLHAICAAYLLIAGCIYAMLHTTYLYRALALYQLALDEAYYPAIAAVHFALASIHTYILAKPLAAAVVTSFLPSRATESLKVTFSVVKRGGLCGKLVSLARCIYGLFSVESNYFELTFFAREVVATVLQTYQAYMMSRLLPREKLNGFYTVTLVINCWTAPLLQRISRGNKLLERLLIVLSHILLDFVSSIGVPVAVAIGYLRQYDPASTDFEPETLYYNDVWLINYLNEIPLMILRSWLDAASRLVFSLGLLLSMDDVRILITRRNEATAAAFLARKTSPATSLPANKLKALGRQASILKWVHRLMVAWGLGIAAIYLEATIRAPPPNCSLALRPWLVSKPACAVVTIDCQTQPALSGDAADFETVYSQLDAGSVQYVIFRHCPNVEFTPRIRTLRNLVGMKTHASTIATWNLTAALTATAHPHVRFAFMTRTQFPNATLPLGLCHEQFPPTLLDIEIAVSNIQWIPPTLPWPPNMAISVEFSQLVEFPLAFPLLQPTGLSLAFNRIATIPLEAVMMSGLIEVFFRGNPVKELPELDIPMTDRHHGPLSMLSLEYTNVSSLPAWVTEQFLDQVQIYAAQTPVCVVLQNTSSPERETWLRERPWLAKVEARCADDSGLVGLYPLQVDSE
jgi:hypothetical protein